MSKHNLTHRTLPAFATTRPRSTERYSEGHSRLALPLALFVCAAMLHGAPQETAGSWIAKGSMAAARTGACAAVLPDSRMLVTGGISRSGVLDSAEAFGLNGSFSSLPAMSAGRTGHTCTAMLDGRVLVAGGGNDVGPIGTAEIYNPAVNRWAEAGIMSSPRSGHTATLLQDGRVVLVGGEG